MMDEGLWWILTASELRVFGTAIRSSSLLDEETISLEECPGSCFAMQWPNEQKFNVFTSRTYNSHGCFLDDVGSSTGSVVLSEASSSSENFQTTSLLSFPWLKNY